MFLSRIKGVRPSTQCRTGQGILEFALFLPLLVLIVIGLIDLGLAFHALIAVTKPSLQKSQAALRQR